MTDQQTFPPCSSNRNDHVNCPSFHKKTYSNNDGGDEPPADLEEQRRGEAQHHLHIFKVLPVACKIQEE